MRHGESAVEGVSSWGGHGAEDEAHTWRASEKPSAGRPWAVSEGVAIKVGEPKMEIDAEVAEEVDADERLHLASPRRRHQRLL